MALGSVNSMQVPLVKLGFWFPTYLQYHSCATVDFYFWGAGGQAPKLETSQISQRPLASSTKLQIFLEGVLQVQENC